MLRKYGQSLQIGQGEVYAEVRREDGGALIGHDTLRRPRVLANGMVIKSARISLHNNPAPAVFFPGVDPQRTFPEAEKPVVTQVEVIEGATAPSEFQFVQISRGKAEDVYADLGLIADDEDEIDQDVEPIDEVSNASLNKQNISEPEEIFEMLATKDIRSFGITKEDFNALKLTKKQIRKLYDSVTGKPSSNQETSSLKKEIRKVASQSYANYKRVMSEIKKIRETQEA